MTPRTLSVRTRILLLLSLLAAAFLAGALSWQWLEKKQAGLLSRQARQDMAVTDEKELALKGESLKMLASDYTCWGEMVTFVRTRDPKWAAENLDTALTTYAAAGVWVYNEGMAPTYSVCSAEAGPLKRFPLPPSALRGAFRGGHSCHFFVRTSRGLLEVRGATIHTTADTKRTGPSFGFFFAGRLWDNVYLESLRELMGSQVQLLAPGAAATPDHAFEADGVFHLSQTLPDWEGRPVAQLHIVADRPGIRELGRSTGKALALFVTFAALLLALLSVCLLRWVSEPLRALSESLKFQKPDLILHVGLEGSEFGDLARIVRAFFEQRAELLGEVQDRMRAEEALQRAHDGLEVRVAERTAELAEANGALQRAYTATIEGWSRAMDLKDHETEGHCRRVTEMTLRLARGFAFDDEQLLHIQRGALLHDIGKMGIPDHILLKPGGLTDDEWVVMRRHPTFALEMLWPIEFLRPAIEIPWCHHEKWDGSGYPRGLRGEEIPLAARLFAVVDVWDALRSDRPYREGWPLSRVCEHLRAQAGSHFDPGVAERFIELIAHGDGRPDDVRLAA